MRVLPLVESLVAAASLTKTGSGAVTLTGASTYTSGTTIGAGTLTLSGANPYAGLTKISGGTPTLGNGNALSSSALNYSSYRASPSVGSLTSVTLGGVPEQPKPGRHRRLQPECCPDRQWQQCDHYLQWTP